MDRGCAPDAVERGPDLPCLTHVSGPGACIARSGQRGVSTVGGGDASYFREAIGSAFPKARAAATAQSDTHMSYVNRARQETLQAFSNYFVHPEDFESYVESSLLLKVTDPGWIWIKVPLGG